MSHDRLQSPPKARLAVRVGVTGHRPRGLEKADSEMLEDKIKSVLTAIKVSVLKLEDKTGGFYRNESPVMRMLSPLAEGADTIAARAGLDAGYELNCILPFLRDEYEKDFNTDESKKLYWDLLSMATSVLELEGARTNHRENESYLDVGRLVLKQSDIIIAVWDGNDAKGTGGTGQIVAEAMLEEIPVVWIEAHTPHEIKIITLDNTGNQNEAGFDDGNIELMLRRIMCPELQEKPGIYKTYFAEKQPEWTWGYIYEVFCDILAGEKLEAEGVNIKDIQPDTKKEWGRVWNIGPDIPDSARTHVTDNFLPHYSWADNLANYYSNIYRSSFVANYLLAGLAVFFALLSVTVSAFEVLWISCEFVLIFLILLITTVGNRKHWHQRWIDYRLLSEQLRQLRFLSLLGLTTPAFRVPAHDTHGDPRNSWVNWHFRAIVRDAGLINARIDTDYMKSFSAILADHEIASQVDYHRRVSPRFKRINHNLHLIGSTLFFLTLVAVFLHFFVYSGWLTLMAAVFPALGAAFFGIRNQGEFEQIAKRSEAMAVNLDYIRQEIKHNKDINSYRKLGFAAEKTAEIMSSEILDWRIFFESKRLVLPV